MNAISGRHSRRSVIERIFVSLWILLLLGSVLRAEANNPAGNLRIELIAGYNFVVRSNIESQPGTSPRSAYLAAKFWNDGTEPLTNVVAHIGDFDYGINPTPGIYPLSDTNNHPNLVGPIGGSFALTHEGGLMGAADATRYLGKIKPGESVAVYWLVSYPLVDENGNAVHGPSVKPDDDLSLRFDVWGEAYDQGTLYTANTSREVYMRRMLQAQANKIFPNNANKVPQEYLDLLQIYAPTWTNSVNDGSPGTSFTTEGYWYDLGNINQGFDNTGDLVPDYNAWMQPVGDPSIFDPSCFRLVGTKTLLVIKRSGGEPDLVIIAEDQLYFSNLPPDNTGGIGLVIYEFMPLRSGCTSQMTPYQAVASGKDNEKFNGDYGAMLGEGLFSTPSSATINKEVDQETAGAGSNLLYTITFTNSGIVAVGQPEVGLPLVVGDSIPEGAVYVAGTAAANNLLPDGVAEYLIFYSTNNGTSWLITEPSPASNVTDIQWWLSDELPTNTYGAVTFEVTVVSEDPPPIIHNVAGLSFGNTVPFAEDDAVTLILGDYLISGTVFADTGDGDGVAGNGEQDGEEPGISNIAVRLYYDVSGNGVLDGNAILFATVETDEDGNYAFTGLPDGHYIVVVDTLDPDLPLGYTPTSPTALAVTLAGEDETGYDFGFAPGLVLEKTGPALVDKGGQAVYSITVSNSLAATTETVQHTAWSTNYEPAFELSGGGAGPVWTDTQNALGTPDGLLATKSFSAQDQNLGVGGFTIPPSSATITNVEVIVTFSGIVPSPADSFRANDGFYVRVYTSASLGTPIAEFGEFLFVTIFGGDGAGTATITNNITLSNSWDWDYFNPANSNLFVVIETDRQGGGRAGTMGVDAIAINVSTDEQLGLLDPVPLYDYYDSQILQFVSATPPVTLSDNNGPAPNTGRLYWENVGPLAPTETTNISVTFNVIGPPGNLGTITTNTAVITNATFSTGVPANEGFSEVPSEVPAVGAIGDTIFWDANRNGTEDDGEAGIPGVLVELYSNATLVASQYTDANGNYMFTNLPPGTYTVVVVPEDGDPNYPLIGAELTADPDADGEPCWSPFAIGCDGQTIVTLMPGQTFLGADFGYDPPGGTIGGLLWIDFNANDLWDPGEDGLAFIPVHLYSNGTLVATTLTDADGLYIFYGLPDGNYSVHVITDDEDFPFPAGLTQTYDRDGFIDNIATNILVSGGSVVSVDGVPCTDCDLQNNFGYRYEGNNSLSGTVGLDDPEDIDGVLNGTNTSGVATGEVAFAGVTVFAYLWHDLNDDGIVDPGETILVGTAITDANGDYLFTDLPDGFDDNPYYIVSVAAPIANIVLTTDADSDPNPSFLVVDNQNLQGNTVSAYQAVEIEPTITNVDFAFVSTLKYDFGDLPESYRTLLTAGARHVVKAEPDLYLGQGVSTEPNGQPSVAADADDFDDGVFASGIWQNGPNGGTVRIEVGEGTGRLLGFIDFNNSGAFDQANELMLDAIVSSTGGPNTNGVYEFNFNIPEGALSTTDTTFLYSRFRLFPENEFILFPQLAFQGEASNGEVEDYRWVFNAINGTVYCDDGDEQFSVDDEPRAGVIIRLFDNEDNEVFSTVTQLDGTYTFYGLSNDNYRIEIEEPFGAGAIFGTNLLVSLNNSSTNKQDFLLDCGTCFANISGTVWEDDGFGVEGDGEFNEDDVPVPGVLVSLYRDINLNNIAEPNEFIGSVITDANGFYEFENLPNGNYIILMTTPDGADSITDADGTEFNESYEIWVALDCEEGDAIEQDFLIDGASNVAALSGLVWFDASRNGIREDNETVRFDGIPVDLLDADGFVVASTTTAGDGTYSFTNVTPGTYTVRFDLTDYTNDYVVAQAFKGNDPTRDSDVTSLDVVYASTDPILLLASSEQEHIDLGLQFPSPTRAAVADLWGEWTGQAEVVWETSSEYGTAAFMLYRVDAETGAETPVLDEWIPSALITGGDRIYRVVDPTMTEYDVGLYRLEELELGGTLWDLGVHEIQFGAPRPQPREARTLSVQTLDMKSFSTVSGPETSDCLKIHVHQDGLYAVSLASIAAAMDQSLSAIQQHVEDGQLGMSSGGQPVAYLYDADAARIVFYGEETTDFYAGDNVYWIRLEDAQTVEQRDPGAAEGATAFPVTARFEENVFPKSYRSSFSGDWYYWNTISSTATGSGGREYPLELPGYAGGDIVLRVRLYGLILGYADHVRIDFNGTLVHALTVVNHDPAMAEVVVPAGLVTGENNTLTVRGQLPPGQTFGVFAMDWIEVDYERTLSPDPQAILFDVHEAAGASIDGFERPLVFDISDPLAPVWIADSAGAVPGGTWNSGDGTRFALIDWNDITALEPTPGVCSAWFMDSRNRLDYVIITSRALESAANEFAEYREQMGLRVGVALIDEIYDLFADGLQTPMAIQSFLRYTHETWKTPPWLVLLAGSGHHDYIHGTLHEINHLPPLLAASPDGIFAADGLLADLNANGRPDIAIGRLPARTGPELAVMLEKIRTYETMHGEEWHSHVALVADPNDDNDFIASSEQLGQAAEDAILHRIYRDQLSVTATRTALLERFALGSGFIHFTGHGNVHLWGKQSFFANSHVGQLNNTRTPVVVALTCLSGRFEDFFLRESLAEQLLRRANGGAVAVWAASGMSYNQPATKLGEAFYQQVFSGGVGTLGKAILRAHHEMIDDPLLGSTFTMYNLLGDPATKLGGVQGTGHYGNRFAQWRWETFRPDELANPGISGPGSKGLDTARNNFLMYALGGATLVTTDDPRERGQGIGRMGMGTAEDLPMAFIRWEQRPDSEDITYRISVSTDLRTWQVNPPGLEVIDRTLTPNNLMERVTARVPFEGDRLYIKLDVIME